MKTTKILIAGFGGQGILFTGKAIAYTGLKAGLEVSWLPSYGPEMRGGTANCSITLSSEQIGSPIVDKPDLLIAMNLPSLEKYFNETEKGGHIIFDSSLIFFIIFLTLFPAFQVFRDRLSQIRSLCRVP